MLSDLSRDSDQTSGADAIIEAGVAGGGGLFSTLSWCVCLCKRETDQVANGKRKKDMF